MPVLVLFPLLQALGLLAFSAAWMTYMTFLATSGDLVSGLSVYSEVVSPNSALKL